MTTTAPAADASRSRLAFALAAAAALPALWLRIAEPSMSHALEAALFGLAIVGAAFLLSWAAEVAQLDISAGLALALLALIAVLPEYAVDFVFAWKGGQAVAAYGASCPSGEPGLASPCSLALANMTGANRLLIGLGWSSVVFIAWYRTRRRRAAAVTTNGDLPVAQATERRDPFGIRLSRPHAVEVAFLAAATLYSLTLPLKHSITAFDALVLVGLFALYMVRLSKAPPEEPHLVGPARWVGGFSPARRRSAVGLMFLWAAVAILLCAEPFAHALVETGHDYGISEFFLVQWLAPLASEAPEFIVAGLFAWRLQTNAALGALVSSKVNQWTLLVGSLPLVFMIASGSLHGLPIEGTQRLELLLTASQSLFAVAVITNLRLSIGEAWWIFLLFWAQFLVSAFAGERLHDEVLLVTSAIYLAMGIWLIATHWREAKALLIDGFRTPYAAMAAGEAA
jgi:cation:H+ antiporter